VKILKTVSCVVLLACYSFGQGVKPANGFVPDAATATRIAEAVLIPIFGKDVTADRPFSAKLNDGVWTVTGTLHCQENLPGPNPVTEVIQCDSQRMTAAFFMCGQIFI
jgi:hypothetical protein